MSHCHFRELRLAMLAAVVLLVHQVHSQSDFCAQECGQYGQGCKKVCPAADCNAKKGNVQADIVILDITSWQYTRGSTPRGGTPASCCDQAKNTTGVNAWVFCSNPEGCGSGCTNYVSRQTKPTSSDTDSQRLPLANFGSFKGCEGDKWPYAMCSLKKVADPKKPSLEPGGDSQGWVSGVVPKPKYGASCPQGFSQAHCTMCAAAKSPATCYKCVTRVSRLSAWDSCGACASLSTPGLQEACVACLADGPVSGTGCASCLGTTTSLAQAERCFDCVAKAPAGSPVQSGNTCANCFGYGVTGSGGRGTAACVACVTGAGPMSAWGRTGCDECNSWTVDDTAGCSACLTKAQSAGDVDGCAACASSSVKNKAACYDCLKKVKPEVKSYCSLGTGSQSVPYDAAKYVSCLTRVPLGANAVTAASDCYSCTYQNKSTADINKCLDNTNKPATSTESAKTG